MIYLAPERITLSNAEAFLHDLLALISTGDELIVDFSNTKYISSACLRSLIIASKTAKHKCQSTIECINLSPSVQNVLDMVRMDVFLKTK